jgi:hypothetical protein
MRQQLRIVIYVVVADMCGARVCMLVSIIRARSFSAGQRFLLAAQVCRRPVQQQHPVLRPTPQGQVRVSLPLLQCGVCISQTYTPVPRCRRGWDITNRLLSCAATDTSGSGRGREVVPASSAVQTLHCVVAFTSCPQYPSMNHRMLPRRYIGNVRASAGVHHLKIESVWHNFFRCRRTSSLWR